MSEERRFQRLALVPRLSLCTRSLNTLFLEVFSWFLAFAAVKAELNGLKRRACSVCFALDACDSQKLQKADEAV